MTTGHPKILHNGEMVHTTNSNGEAIHHTEQGIKNFHDWFSGSKTTDEHGRPKVFYHGSVNRDLEQFDPNITPVRPRSGPNGTYFTTNQMSASGYTRPPIGQPKRATSGSVTHAYLNLKNPLDITDGIKKLQKKGSTFGDAKRESLTKLDTEKHDSVIFRGNSINTDEYIALHAHQIKSAKNNNGDFSSVDKINENRTFKEYLDGVRGNT